MVRRRTLAVNDPASRELLHEVRALGQPLRGSTDLGPILGDRCRLPAPIRAVRELGTDGPAATV